MKVKMKLVSIKRVNLVLFFFIIYCNALSSSFSESTLIPKADSYKHLAKEKPIKNVYGSKVMKPNEVEEKSKALKGFLNLETDVTKGKECVVGINNQSKKANKGGAYGGGDLLKPRSRKGGASSISLKSSSSIAIEALALGLLLLVFL